MTDRKTATIKKLMEHTDTVLTFEHLSEYSEDKLIDMWRKHLLSPLNS